MKKVGALILELAQVLLLFFILLSFIFYELKTYGVIIVIILLLISIYRLFKNIRQLK